MRASVKGRLSRAAGGNEPLCLWGETNSEKEVGRLKAVLTSRQGQLKAAQGANDSGCECGRLKAVRFARGRWLKAGAHAWQCGGVRLKAVLLRAGGVG